MKKYRVIFSKQWKRNVVHLCEQARAEGRLAQAKAGLEELIHSLEENPEILGEKVYHLKQLGLPMNHVVRLPWSLHFATDQVRRLVYTSDIKLLSK